MRGSGKINPELPEDSVRVSPETGDSQDPADSPQDPPPTPLCL